MAERQGQIENKKTILMQMYAYKLSQLQSPDKGRGGIGDIRKGAHSTQRNIECLAPGLGSMRLNFSSLSCTL